MALVRVAIYTRVSGAEQKKGWSLQKQQQDLRAYCARMPDYEVKRSLWEVNSGRNPLRPKMVTLLELAAMGAYDVLVVWRGDRFGRSTKLYLAMEDYLRSCGVRLESMMVGQQPDNATTRYFGRVTAATSEFELESILERCDGGKVTCAEAGRWPLAVPKGWCKPKDWRKGRPATDLLVDEERARLVRRVYEAAAEGLTLREIARLVGARSHQNILPMLHNPIFKGEGEFAGIRVPFPPIVDPGLWQRAQEALAAKRRNREQGAGQPSSKSAAPWAMARRPWQFWRRFEGMDVSDKREALRVHLMSWGLQASASHRARRPVPPVVEAGEGRIEDREAQWRRRQGVLNAHRAGARVPGTKLKPPER
jgi:site-specific DNA recombinase